MSGELEPRSSGVRLIDALPELARERLSAEVHGYIVQGSGDGLSAAEAEAAWHRFRFLPRVLVDVREVATAVTVLGEQLDTPFGIAPTTLQLAVHPEGERAMAQAAAAVGCPVVVSSNAGTRFADIGGTGARWWLQLYLTADRSRCLPVLDAAVAAGARAVVLTVDTPVVATKYGAAARVWESVEPTSLRVNFAAAGDDDPGSAKARDLGPGDIAWLRERSGLPVVVKGVLHPDDARRCVDAGAAAVWVSNHGGRQLDRAVPTATALPGVAAEVAPDAEVYVDGGVRRGADALVARALGATAVFLGRPPLWALAEGGSEGVRRLFQELRAELEEAMVLAGAVSWAAVTPGLLAWPDPARQAVQVTPVDASATFD